MLIQSVVDSVRGLMAGGQPEAGLGGYLRAISEAETREAGKDKAIRLLSAALNEFQMVEALRVREESSRESDLEAAFAMSGAGPWRMPGAAGGEGGFQALKESMPLGSAQGAYGDMELALQNLDWRREINSSWLEFSRWGIQQIILISRLYFVKNPLIQRGVNVSAIYVFGRGVDVTSTDEAANEVLRQFFERNKKTLGQTALADLERRKFYDGNLFFVFFPDPVNRGEVNIRTIDALEVMEIVTNPDDVDEPWLYKRIWTQQEFDTEHGSMRPVTRTAWYPAVGYTPAVKEPAIATHPVMWETPVYHRKCGGVGKWRFGCPLVYAALDWAQASRRFLENCMTIRDALAQFAMILTTKGGQAALQGAKQQLATTVGPSSSLWDENPTAVTGSIAAMGSGTELKPFVTTGAGGDPSEVRQYKLMASMVFGLPESFFGDMETGNLATATSLDRPTELGFMAKQEEWREDLSVIAKYVLSTSASALNGKLREAHGEAAKGLRIYEAPKALNARGESTYKVNTSAEAKADIQVMVNFPSIIEADVPAMVQAVVNAGMATSGQFLGIDQKELVRLLYRLVGVDQAEEVLEAQFPTDGPDAYNPLREKPEPAVDPNTDPEADPKVAKDKKPAAKVAKESMATLRAALNRVGKAIRLMEREAEGEEAE